MKNYFVTIIIACPLTISLAINLVAGFLDTLAKR